MKTNATLLVCTHKKFNLNTDEFFLPIHVGKEISDLELNIQADNEGINISNKNQNYCELTALFWAWKNLKTNGFVGLCHYRRFFIFSKLKKYNEITEDFFLHNLDSFKFNPNKMTNCDIFLATPIVLKTSLAEDYIYCHIAEEFEILRATVYELYPEYKESFVKIMDHNNKLSPYNMFVTTNVIFEDYSSWLFSILFEVENRIQISKYPYQQRVFGFMAERLLNVFVHHKKLKIKYLPVVLIGSEMNFLPIYKRLAINFVKQTMFVLGKSKNKL